MPCIDANTMLYGIIGHPVRHSFSPLIHNFAFKTLNINAIYLAFDVTDLPSAALGIRALGIKGLSVTIPHKTSIMPLLDEVDDTARQIGAVNTIINRGGWLIGTNTDWIGVVSAIKERGKIQGKDYLILGAGGAARAVAYGLKKEGAKVVICNRTYEKARSLAEELDLEVIKWEDRNDFRAYGLVNTTPVGMWPEVDKSPMEQKALKNYALVMDAVYRPLETCLLKQAKLAGCLCVDGLKMLIYQGVEQFKLWTGKEPPIEGMFKIAIEILQNEQN